MKRRTPLPSVHTRVYGYRYTHMARVYTCASVYCYRDLIIIIPARASRATFRKCTRPLSISTRARNHGRFDGSIKSAIHRIGGLIRKRAQARRVYLGRRFGGRTVMSVIKTKERKRDRQEEKKNTRGVSKNPPVERRSSSRDFTSTREIAKVSTKSGAKSTVATGQGRSIVIQ